MGTIKFKGNDEMISAQEGVQNNEVLQENTEIQGNQGITPESYGVKRLGDDSVLFEDKAKRSENSKVFQLNNGTAKEIISNNPMHYYDEKEQRLRTIDNRLAENESGFESQHGIYKAEVAKTLDGNKTIKYSKDNLGLEWVYLPKHIHDDGQACHCAVVNTESLSPSSDVKYENIEPNVDLEYQLLGNNVKENIVVREKQDEYKYSFRLKTNGLTLRLSEDNANIELYSVKQNEQGETQETKEFTIPSPFMFDARGELSDDVYYEVEPLQNDEYIFHVVASSDWINEENRELPITIDPQIVTNNTAIFSYQNYYRYLSSSSSGSGGSSWYTANYGTIQAGRNGSYEYKTELTIKKSRLNLQNNKISKAILKLKPTSSYTSGPIYLNGNYQYISNGNVVEQDITSTYKAYSNDFTISVEPYYNANSVIQFYSSGIYAPMLEVEYLTNEKTRLTKKSFSLAGIATGELNLATGEMVTSFDDVVSDGSVLGYQIFHVYKKSSENNNVGTNFRLNLHEKLVKNSDSYFDANYIYTDSSGEKHGFKDTYYYLNSSDTKVTVNKTNVTVELDGRLMYSGYEVHKEQHTASGLKAVTTLEGFKNVDLIEQRQDEVKQLDEQVEAYRTNLKDIVCVNKSDGTIYTRLKNYFSGDNLTKSQFDSFMNTVTTSRLVLSENEALSYRSMELQYTALGYQDTVTGYQINSMTHQSTAMGLQIDSINNSIDRANRKDETKLNTAETTNYNSTKDNLGNQRRYNDYQKDLTISSIRPNASSQRSNLYNQITALENKRSYYIEQIKKMFKEYINKNFESEQSKKQLPVNYLTDGKIIKGFNKAGKLVAVYDNYNNSIVIEYDYKDRISKVYEGETKANIFKYNTSNLLTSITDTRGRKTKYSYSSSKLTKVTFADGRIMNIDYDSYNNINYVKSSNKLLTTMTQGASKLTITDCSTVDKITKSTTADASTGSFQIAQTEVTFGTNNTVVDDKKGNKEYYIFNSEGNNTEYYLEEQGKVTKAEQYEYVPYSTNKIKYAKKDTLNLTPKSNFTFVLEDYEYTTLNEFNNPKLVETNARKIDVNSTKKSETTYTYDNDQKCEMTNSQITLTIPTGTKIYTAVAKYNYNASGDTVRMERYVEDEELTNGIAIEETFYDDKGNQIKSVSYNSLDTSSKFYTEREIAENGQTLTEFDETGQNKTRLGYIDGTNIVANETLPNGSKFAYGRDVDDTVTSITQNTADGEENSTQTHYTCGVVTELKSGNNVVNYEYDQKRRITKVGLNGNRNYLSNAYTDNTAESGVDGTVDKVVSTNAKNETFTSITDNQGNLRKVKYGSTEQVSSTCDSKNRLSGFTDNVDGAYSYEYDSLDRITKFKKGTTQLENYTYDNYGKLSAKAITNNGVSHAYGYTYTDDLTKKLASISVNGLTISPKYDMLNRKSEKVVSANPGKILGEYYYYSKFGDHATNRISTIRYGNKTGSDYAIGDNLKYAYDSMGNISKVYENGLLQVCYSYDKLNRLVRENNKKLNKTYLFAYDNNGNIISKSECSYTVKQLEELEELSTFHYSYADNSDRLMSYNGESFVYDEIGNPITYRGKTLAWTKGRQLTNYNGTVFTYNGQGQRTGKGSTTFTYDSAGNLIKQSNGLEYLYDESGVFGFIYNSTTYLELVFTK